MIGSLAYTHHDSLVQVSCWGNALAFDHDSKGLAHIELEILKYSNLCGIQKARGHRVLWQRTPSPSRNAEAARSVIPFNFDTWRHADIAMSRKAADGVVMRTRNQTVAFTSRDCPFLTLSSQSAECVMTMHCGRDQLHNYGSTENESVVLNAVPMFGDGVDLKSIRGVITMGIAPEHFPNDRYPDITQALANRWGRDVIPDPQQHTIDLKELILRQLEHCGIPRENIAHDGVDTFSDERFASWRAKRKRHNLTFVTFK